MSESDSSPQRHALSVEDLDFLKDAFEVARIWVEDGGPATCVIQPDHLRDPEMFGMLMVDTIRHGARAFAQRCEISEDEALRRIWSGLEEERLEHTCEINTLQDYERPN